MQRGGKLATGFHIAGYLLLAASLLTGNAVALVVLIPTGVVCVLLGIVLWVRAVWRDARQKGLL